MAFMEPQYEHGTFVYVRGPGEDLDGDHAVPVAKYREEDHGRERARETGWFYRFSAPGYLDCTDWYGPFTTEQACRDEILEDGVDPDTGDFLPDDG